MAGILMLPGLAPHHTRASFSEKQRNNRIVQLTSPEDFELTESGLWLLPAQFTENDRIAGEARLARASEIQAIEGLKKDSEQNKGLAKILANTAISSSGCMLKRGRQIDPPLTARRLAEREMGTFILDEDIDAPHLRVCDCPDCHNPRHYDFSFGRENLREKAVELNPNLYTTLDSGEIRTVWGETLPSIKESLESFIKFQRINFPFVNRKESILTPVATSQVQFHPVTGCWEAWSYYCRPRDVNTSWQFDGYGRLYFKLERNTVNKTTGEITRKFINGHYLAHRVLWHILKDEPLMRGMVLNHRCSYRRCCNPDHLEQISSEENNNHGIAVRKAINAVESISDDTMISYLRPRELVQQKRELLELYRQIA